MDNSFFARVTAAELDGWQFCCMREVLSADRSHFEMWIIFKRGSAVKATLERPPDGKSIPACESFEYDRGTKRFDFGGCINAPGSIVKFVLDEED